LLSESALDAQTWTGQDRLRSIQSGGDNGTKIGATVRAIVTGGAGFIGSHVVDSLLARDIEVVVIDSLVTGDESRLPDGARLIKLDIGSDQLPALFEEFRPDLVSHLAAQASVTHSVADPIGDSITNIIGGLRVMQAAVAAGCPRLIYINTGGALYGNSAQQPFDEDSLIEPVSPYGLSKWTLERYLQMLIPDQMDLAVLRLANVYGPRQDPHGEAGVVAIFSRRMLEGAPVEIFGDGEQTRDFVFVGDVVTAHSSAIETPGRYSVNISSGVGRTVNSVFEVIASSTDYELPAQYEPARQGEVRHSVLNNQRAQQLLSWSPAISFEVGAEQTIEWVRSTTR
jgi:UDP-glucose 4-epimerase